MVRRRLIGQCVTAFGVLAVVFGPLLATLVFADSRDGPIFVNTAVVGQPGRR